jgi:hypothetical protein
VRTHSRAQEESLGSRLLLRATYVALVLATAAALSGCPGGAELENPERFRQYDGGPPGVGGASGASGGGGVPGTGGMAGAGGAAAGTGPGYVWRCGTDVTMALKQNCARGGCHTGASVLTSAGLDLTTVEKVREMVNKPASYGDIGCNVPPETFRECAPTELPAGCVPGKLLIDPVNFDDSWVLRKLTAMTKAELSCGDLMPLAPGNSVSSGWSDERKQCYIELFRSLTVPQ